MLLIWIWAMSKPEPTVTVESAPRSDTWTRLWSLLLRPVESAKAQEKDKPATKG